MIDKNGTEWLDFLSCPSCRLPVESMPPRQPNEDYPFPHWSLDTEGVCEKCGTEVVVREGPDDCTVYLGDENE